MRKFNRTRKKHLTFQALVHILIAVEARFAWRALAHSTSVDGWRLAAMTRFRQTRVVQMTAQSWKKDKTGTLVYTPALFLQQACPEMVSELIKTGKMFVWFCFEISELWSSCEHKESRWGESETVETHCMVGTTQWARPHQIGQFTF